MQIHIVIFTTYIFFFKNSPIIVCFPERNGGLYPAAHFCVNRICVYTNNAVPIQHLPKNPIQKQNPKTPTLFARNFRWETLRWSVFGVRRIDKYVAATEILNQAFIAKRPANKSKKCCMLNLSPCNTFADKIDEKRLVRDFFGASFWREDIVVPFVTTYAIPLRPAFATSYIPKNSIA